jgi:hypothetical protein
MVGVPGDRFSNMAPPTFVLVALLAFQAGVAELLPPGDRAGARNGRGSGRSARSSTGSRCRCSCST